MSDAADVLSNLTTAFYTRFTELTGGVNNAFYLAVNGRMFEEQAPEGTEYPYSVYGIVAAPKEKTFSEEFTNTLLQIDFFSSTSSSGEVKDIYQHAHDLYDDCTFTVTGSNFVWMKEVNMVTTREEVITPEGTQKVWHYSADFEVKSILT